MAEVENENCLIANRMVYELRLITSLRAKAERSHLRGGKA